MKIAPATLLVVAALMLAGCGAASQPPAGETNVSPQRPAPVTQPAPPSPPAPAPAAPRKVPTVTGKVSVHVGAVKLMGGGKERDYLEGTGPVEGATVTFFAGDQVLGQVKTNDIGWTQSVTVTVPLDSRIALIRKAYEADGKAEDLPGVVSALVTREGYRPTLMTDLGVTPGKGSGYGVNLFKLGDSVQHEGVDLAPDGPITQAQPLAWDNRGSHLGRDLVKTIQAQVSAPPTTAAPPEGSTVTGNIAVNVGAVKLMGGGKERVYREGTGPIEGATVIFFAGDKVVGQAKTNDTGWTQPVSVTVPLDDRVAMLYGAYTAAGQVEDLPGIVSALVIKEGYRPTVVTNLSVPAGKGTSVGGLDMFKLGDPVQDDGVGLAPDGPMTQSLALPSDNRGRNLGRDLVQAIEDQVRAGKVPALKE